MADSATPSLIDRAHLHLGRESIVDRDGTYSYDALLDASSRIAGELLTGRRDLDEAPVAILITPGFAWVATLLGVWRAGGIAVPLPLNSPASELDWYFADTRAPVLIHDAANEEIASAVAALRRIRSCSCREMLAGMTTPLPSVDTQRRAMILYTSGTTSRPKGVVTTHDNITAQITTLAGAWEWTDKDRIVLCLPLHHVHGIVNVVLCALWSGAVCEMLPRFDADAVWERIGSGRVTLFMAVPTIYVKLIAAWEAYPPDRREMLSKAAAGLRLMVSGSAALPISTLERWRQITGHTLLERYGMTEIGMALSNSYCGMRVPGSVGVHLPWVEVRLVNEQGAEVAPGTPGEIEVRGLNVFREYWRNPEATRSAFRDGWFRTGDTAIVENGVYRILGRTNIDILKTGGHKVSALEIEEVLRQHPAIADCAVVGVDDPEWGQRVSAAAVLRPGSELDLESLRDWCRPQMASHKIPSRLLILTALPRNAMGKVTKSEVAKLFGSQREGKPE